MNYLLKINLAFLFCFLFQNAIGQTTVTVGSSILEVEVLSTGLDIPWEVQFNPADNQLWITERYGMISRIDTIDGTKEELLDISGVVYQNSESGLLGLVLHPDFANNGFVYVVYTYVSGSIKERLVRYTWDGSSLGNPFVLIEDIPGNTTHIGSRLLFLPDGTLIMTTGDAQNQPSSQDMSAMTGKILRFNDDGTIPADNPNPASHIWSFGHRNAQGLALGPNGVLYSSEHGPTTDDELNIITKNANYGWPDVHGFCDNPNENAFCASTTVTEPIAAWTPTIAPSDLIWYDHPAIPEFQNSLLMTVLKNKKLINFHMDGSGNKMMSQVDYFTNTFNRLRDIAQGPRGELYLATNGVSWSNTNPFTHRIIKLTNINPSLPVELMDFKGAIENKNAMLSWSTATELNNEGFEVQRSTNARDFSKIAWIDGAGNSSDVIQYDFEDSNLEADVVYYYRLKQIDFDGQFSYSPTITVQFKDDDAFPTASFFPNPTKDGTTQLQINNFQAGKIVVKIYDTVGRAVYHVENSLMDNESLFQLDLHHLPKGIYIGEIQSENHTARELLQIM